MPTANPTPRIFYKIEITYSDAADYKCGKKEFISGCSIIPKSDRYGKEFHTMKLANRMLESIKDTPSYERGDYTLRIIGYQAVEFVSSDEPLTQDNFRPK